MLTKSNFFLGLLGSLTVITVTTPSVKASSINLQYLGQSIITTGTTFDGTEVGGLSGITYDLDTENFYIIADDRSQINPARFYTASINPSLFNASGNNNGVTFQAVTTILDSNGQPFQPFNLDPEGIAVVGSDLYISSEGEVSSNRIIDPFINQFSLSTGQQTSTLPIPTQFIPEPKSIPTTNGVRNNLSLESVAVTPDKRFLFSASENALVQDGPIATLSNGSPSRILQYDLTTGQAIAQFLYETDPVALPPNPSNAFNTTGLVELLALDNTGKHFLSLERSFSTGAVGTPGNTGNTVKIYEVSLDGATDISGLASIDGVSGIVGASKTLLLDLTSLGIPIDNVEGISFGPNLPSGERSLILVSDNNFSPTQFTQFLAFRVGGATPQSVPEPSVLGGLLVIGCSAIFTKKKP